MRRRKRFAHRPIGPVRRAGPPREGSRRGSEYALLMNRYDCNLMRDRDKWRFKRMTIDNAWALGNPEILNALASRLALRTKSKKTA